MMTGRDPVLLFDDIHQSFHPMVLQMCLGYARGDVDTAKDITQEVFINVWNALPKFRNESSPKTWIYRITVNTCLLHIRSAKKQQFISIADDATFAGDETFSSGAVAGDPGADSRPAEYLELYRAIGRLPEIERLIIMLVLEEVPYDEISAITGISAVNLRVKIYRSKKQLAKLLKMDRNF